MAELSYAQRRGQGYDRYFGHVSREFVGDTGGPIAIEVEIGFASGRR